MNTALLLLPHGILEITWMMAISGFSITLSQAAKTLLDSDLEDKRFFRLLFSWITLLLFSLVVIAAGIEAYITPLIFNLFH